MESIQDNLVWLVQFFALLVDIMLHLDVYVERVGEQYGLWLYAILCIVVFAETGLVVFPFLPGDSLLFVAGGIAALGKLDLLILMCLLITAGVAGNTLNYWVGRWFGQALLRRGDRWYFSQNSYQKTMIFYEKHGGKAVVLSRFLPLFRTFVPFVAGVANMGFMRFCMFNLAGASVWVVSLCCAGFFLGEQPIVKNNLTLIVVLVVLVSLFPFLYAVGKGLWQKHTTR